MIARADGIEVRAGVILASRRTGREKGKEKQTRDRCCFHKPAMLAVNAQIHGADGQEIFATSFALSFED